MRFCLTRLGTVCAGVLLAGMALAQTSIVTLEATDGSFTLTGEITGFDGTAYTIESALGTKIITAAEVTCSGTACPDEGPSPTEPSLNAPASGATEPAATSQTAPAPDTAAETEPAAISRPAPDGFVLSASAALSETLIPALVEGFSLSRDADLMISAGADGIGRFSLAPGPDMPRSEITLRADGSTAAIAQAIAGEAALIMTTRPLRDAEIAAASEAGATGLADGSAGSVLALDALVIVTARENPVRALTVSQIAGIYSGEITNWSQVGGRDLPIRVLTRAETTDTGAMFYNRIMLPERRRVSARATVLDSDAAVSDAVALDPAAIGISSHSAERTARALAIRGSCGVMTPANSFTIRTEEYPLIRRLYMYGPAQDAEAQLARDLHDYVRSAEAQRIIAQAGFVDQSVAARAIDQMGLRVVLAVLPEEAAENFAEIRGMMRLFVAAERLSLTFRFEQGSSDLDPRGRTDMARLASMIEAGAFENKEIILVGFTDSVGQADVNRVLSLQRAGQTRDVLRAAVGAQHPVRIRAAGFGELSPLGCNDTVRGREINRRVEVWTRDILD